MISQYRMRTRVEWRAPEADAKGATEDQMVSIREIDVLEALGYRGEGREEHSGENAPSTFDGLEWELADNAPAQVLIDD